MCRVLIVEDDLATRELLRDLLEAYGHAVIEAETWFDASEILETECIELALIDGQFPKDRPGGSLGDYGPVLCQQARSRGARTLLLSANDELVETEQRTGHAAMTKPFALQALRDAIEATMAVAI